MANYFIFRAQVVITGEKGKKPDTEYKYLNKKYKTSHPDIYLAGLKALMFDDEIREVEKANRKAK